MTIGKNFYQYFQYTMTAGKIITIETDANFLYVISNTSNVDIKVSIGGQSFQSLPAGLSVELPREEKEIFTQLQFQNVDVSSTVLTIAISNGRIVNNNTQISGSIQTDASANNITSGQVVATTTAADESIAADADQRELLLYNNGANVVWVGDANVDGAAGIGTPIAPGDLLVLSTSAEVFLHSVGGNSQISFNRLKRT